MPLPDTNMTNVGYRKMARMPEPLKSRPFPRKGPTSTGVFSSCSLNISGASRSPTNICTSACTLVGSLGPLELLTSYANKSPLAIKSGFLFRNWDGGGLDTASWYSWPPTRRTVAFCPGDLYALRRGTRSRLTSAKTTTLRRPGATSSDRRKMAEFQSGASSAQNLVSYHLMRSGNWMRSSSSETADVLTGIRRLMPACFLLPIIT
mmetsp:Transcript_364/g.911  ORF Transcript_364/g.911 Transcript_364/m.911 type:complete len:206 (+) Transcript_364:811-1428(+)